MVVGQLYYSIAIEKTAQNDIISSYPLLGLVDLFLYVAVFNKIRKFFSKFWYFLQSRLDSGDSKVKIEKHISDYELSHQESLVHGSRDDGTLARDEVKTVMEKLGIFCSSESEELQQSYGSNELSDLFEEQEPSLEEVKQTFDVFDQNRDGYIDERELQRVLCILGLKEATEQENCQKMIKTFDENGDGRIDFNEFVKIIEKSFC